EDGIRDFHVTGVQTCALPIWIKADLAGSGFTPAQAALKFSLSHPAVSTVIAGIRSPAQAEMNLAVSDLPDLPPALMEKLRLHNRSEARRGGDGGTPADVAETG